MDNKISLKDWLFYFQDKEVYQDLIYGLHHECHRLYATSNLGVPYLDIRNSLSLGQVLAKIQVNPINFKDVNYMDTAIVPLDQKSVLQQSNVMFLASLAMNFYLDYHYENGLLNYQFLESNFKECKQFIPPEDVGYYEDVFINHNYKFYDEWKKSHQSSGNSRGIQYVKGGTGYSSDEDEMRDGLQTAAFSQSAFLAILFFGVAMAVTSIIFLVTR